MNSIPKTTPEMRYRRRIRRQHGASAQAIPGPTRGRAGIEGDG